MKHSSSIEKPVTIGQSAASGDRSLWLLSRLLLRGYKGDFSAPARDLSPLLPELPIIRELDEERFTELMKLADTHHVTVRALNVMEQLMGESRNELPEWWRAKREKERQRSRRAIEWLSAIITALESSGCSVAVIKSLDHQPDLGSDLDLYTDGRAEQVVSVMQEKLGAAVEPRSWGDRLAGKWNFRVPTLPELVEVHVRYLGQTGEQRLMAARVLDRKVRQTVNGQTFPVPAPEERILISTLQRMYRHFYFRLCDIADVAALLDQRAVNFAELRRGAELGGVWPGVASFLVLISEYTNNYGRRLEIPREVIASAYAPELRLSRRGDFLRIPMGPAAGLYGSQLLNASRHHDLRAMSRLPLLPPLAISALLAYRLTGNDKGVW